MSNPSGAVRRGVAAALSILATIFLAHTASAQAQSPTEVRDGYYRAAERVDVPGPVQGDVIAAGRDVVIGHDVTGDVIAAGRTVALRATAHDDVRVAGGEVTLDAPIAGDITAAGRSIVIGPSARVTGRTWVSGGTVKVEGLLEREARVAGGTVQIAGELRRPVRIAAQKLEILSGARVMAPLTYEGPSPAQVSAGAVLASPIIYHKTAGAEASRLPSLGTTLIFMLHLFVGGFLLYLLVPRIATDPERVLRVQPGRSLLIGFALLVTVPVAALLLVVSLIGLPLGLALGAVYFAALFLGIVTTAFYIGSVEATLFAGAPITTRRRQAAYLLAGVATLAVLRAIPVLGGLAVFLAVVFGLGALGLWVYRSFHGLPLVGEIPAAP